MSDLDKALADVWDATAVEDEPAAFNAAVLERIARRRALHELGFAALIAVAVWAIASALGPAVAGFAAPLAQMINTTPVVTVIVLVGAGLGLIAVMRGRFKVEPGFWSLGLRR
jgi:ferric-dicitrate binding protein FerR (iron transport regulator)